MVPSGLSPSAAAPPSAAANWRCPRQHDGPNCSVRRNLQFGLGVSRLFDELSGEVWLFAVAFWPVKDVRAIARTEVLGAL